MELDGSWACDRRERASTDGLVDDSSRHRSPESRRPNKTYGLDFSASGLRLASITVMVNYLATLVVVARFWDYEVFVVPLVLPVLIPLSARVLRTGGRRTVHRLVLVSWLALAILLVFIRAGKIAVWLASYQERMPVPCWLLLKTKFRRTHEYLAPTNIIFTQWNQQDRIIFSFEPSRLTA